MHRANLESNTHGWISQNRRDVDCSSRYLCRLGFYQSIFGYISRSSFVEATKFWESILFFHLHSGANRKSLPTWDMSHFLSNFLRFKDFFRRCRDGFVFIEARLSSIPTVICQCVIDSWCSQYVQAISWIMWRHLKKKKPCDINSQAPFNMTSNNAVRGKQFRKRWNLIKS